jgi:nitroreductase
MGFNTSINDLINQRLSCRTYKKQALSDLDLKELSDFIKSNGIGPLNNQIRIKILAARHDDSQVLRGLGTYGFIQDPTGFIIGAINDHPGSLLDFGYVLEVIILKATELGIGSCWLGGTFTKSRFAAKMDLERGEDIPSVISIGYPSDQQAFVDRVSRIYAGSDRRLPWEDLFFDHSFQTTLDPNTAGSFKEALSMVRLAPSASNKQPWRVVKDDHTWHFFIHRTRKYPPVGFKLLLNAADLQMIDLGIAMSHFDLSLRENGTAGKWLYNDPGITLPDDLTEYCISWKPN